MPPNKWDQYSIEAKVMAILLEVKLNKNFGRPFLSAYQLAIAFAKKYPDETRAMGLPIGGQGIGQPNSLAQYLAGQLVKRLKAGQLAQIECAFLSKNHISELRFRTESGKAITSSLTAAWDVSLFRLRQ